MYTTSILSTPNFLSSNYQKHTNTFRHSMEILSSNDTAAVPGNTTGANISISERFKSQLEMTQASKINLQLAQNFLQVKISSNQITNDFLTRMAGLTSELLGQQDPVLFTNLNAEFQVLKNGLNEFSHQLFDNKQTTSRDIILSFDSNTSSQTLRHWDQNGRIERSFESRFNALGTDANEVMIGFDPTLSFSMSNTGKELYYVRDDGDGNFNLTTYNIKENTITIGATLSGATARIYVDRKNTLYLSDNNTLLTVDPSTSTTLITPANAPVNMFDEAPFAVNESYQVTNSTATAATFVTYLDLNNDIIKLNLNSGLSTTINPLLDVTYQGVNPATLFGSDLKGAGSPTGTYAVDVIDTNGFGTADAKLRLINTSTAFNQYNGIVIDLANISFNEIESIAINQDANRIYFHNGGTNQIQYISYFQDTFGSYTTSEPITVIQGTNPNSLNGLSLEGSNPSSNYNATAWEGSLATVEYSAENLTLRNLNLLDATLTSADEVIRTRKLIEDAVDIAGLELSKSVGTFTRLEYLNQNVYNFEIAAQKEVAALRQPEKLTEVSRLATSQLLSQTTLSLLGKFHQLQQSVLSLLIN